MKNNTYSRNFATILYQESMNSDYINILKNSGVPCYVSPLHDSDVNENGDPKKPHYHLLLCFKDNTSPNTAKALFNALGGVGCETVRNKIAYERYLIHADNKEKAQYDRNAVLQFNNVADYANCLVAGNGGLQKREFALWFVRYIDKNVLINFNSTIVLLQSENDLEHLDMVLKYASLAKDMLRANEYELYRSRSNETHERLLELDRQVDNEKGFEDINMHVSIDDSIINFEQSELPILRFNPKTGLETNEINLPLLKKMYE